jgi:hypothetical protein
MAQAKATELFNTFVKGIITEAGPLTYPENASIDEANTVLFRKGNRARRLGIDYFSLSTTTIPVDKELEEINEFIWEAPDNDANETLLALQVGYNVHFFCLCNDDIIAHKKEYVLDLRPFLAPGKVASDVAQNRVSFASGKGFLFVVCAATEPVLVEYKPETNTFTAKAVVIQIRDFDGIDDGLAPDEEPATLSATHQYNLHNQGWGQGSGNTHSYYDPFKGQYVTYTVPSAGTNPVSAYFAETGRYPGNNKQWWVAKASVADPDAGVELGDFLPDVLNKFTSGNARAPRGHFVLNAFNKDRSFASGIAGIPPAVTKERPNSVAFYSGRPWYGSGSTVYFSQVMTDKGKAGQCFQEADPTSEDISDLVATDGGVIPIPEANNIISLVPSGDGLLVFAINGIWFINGAENGFTAVDYSVTKVGPVGTQNARAFVATKNTVFWWSDEGIISMSQNTSAFGSVPGDYNNDNITLPTIQRIYNGIPSFAKTYVKSVFDYRNNKIYWLYNTKTTNNKTTYNAAIILDLSLGAFSRWTISEAEGFPTVVGAYTVPALVETLNNILYDGDERLGPVRFLTVLNNNFYLAEAASPEFVDWFSHDGQGLPYNSFVECGYVIKEDAMRKKQAPNITVVMEPTGSSESCYFQVKWDWAKDSFTNKFSNPVQVYRYSRFRPIDNTFESGYNTVVTKNRIRGSGRAMVFRFFSDEAGKDFSILGWQPQYLGNTNV